MTTLIGILEGIGAFVTATAARFGVVAIVGAAVLVPAVGLALLWRVVTRSRRLDRAGDVSYQRSAFYAPNHTWLATRLPGELAVGIDDIARRILPSATSVDLPSPGTRFHRGDPIAVVHAGRHVVRIGAPVDGEVVRANDGVRRDPELVLREPYGRGWLFSIAPDDADYMRLPQGAEAAHWLRSERLRLSRFVEDELGLAAADGGDLGDPRPGLLGEDGWRKVVFSFLHAA